MDTLGYALGDLLEVPAALDELREEGMPTSKKVVRWLLFLAVSVAFLAFSAWSVYQCVQSYRRPSWSSGAEEVHRLGYPGLVMCDVSIRSLGFYGDMTCSGVLPNVTGVGVVGGDTGARAAAAAVQSHHHHHHNRTGCLGGCRQFPTVCSCVMSPDGAEQNTNCTVQQLCLVPGGGKGGSTSGGDSGGLGAEVPCTLVSFGKTAEATNAASTLEVVFKPMTLKALDGDGGVGGGTVCNLTTRFLVGVFDPRHGETPRSSGKPVAFSGIGSLVSLSLTEQSHEYMWWRGSKTSWVVTSSSSPLLDGGSLVLDRTVVLASFSDFELLTYTEFASSDIITTVGIICGALAFTRGFSAIVMGVLGCCFWRAKREAGARDGDGDDQDDGEIRGSGGRGRGSGRGGSVGQGIDTDGTGMDDTDDENRGLIQ